MDSILIVGTFEWFAKGQDYYVDYINPNMITIDLSANNLSGEVPLELFQLVQLQTLNLSHNNLIGTIPKTIRGMKFILQQFSWNNSNRNSLQSFNVSSYIGNPNLCGAPLKNCSTKEENPKNETPSRGNKDGDSIRESLYLGMGVGFAVGFWGICGSLFLIRKWRHAYYRFVDGVRDKLYVTLMVKLNSFRRSLSSC